MVFGINLGISKTKNKSDTNYNETGTETPIIPEQWQNFYNSIQGYVGQSGLSPEQQQAAGYFSGQLQNNPYLGQISAINSTLMGQQPITAQGYTQVPVYGRQSEATAVGAVNGVKTPLGSSYMGAYSNPYEQQVVQAGLGDLYQGAAEGLNQLQAKYAGSGAFGGGRQGVAEGQLMGDVARAAGTLSANTRAQGFNTAAQLGQADAGRDLSALQGNQQVDAQRSMLQAQLEAQRAEQNAQRAWMADQLNANQNMQGQFFNITNDLNAQGQNADNSARNAQLIVNNLLAQNGIQTGNAQNLSGVGGTGIDQLLALLGIGTGTFGSTRNTTGNRSTVGSGTGISAGGSVGGA